MAEDHPDLSRSLVEGLREEGYAVDMCRDGNEAVNSARINPYDCILLDIMLPGIDGWSVLRTLRSEGIRSAVICLTARDAVKDRANGLDLGADDYLVKPFEWVELLARIRAVIRRSREHTSTVLKVSDLEVDVARKSVRRGGRPLTLPAKEFALLTYLAHHEGKVISRTELWEHLYDGQDELGSNVIDVYIASLRRKIDQDQPVKLIHTRRGQGYVLTDQT
ncbi:MAG: response regulator transcription factor [Phycisphaeraceae bacterium]